MATAQKDIVIAALPSRVWNLLGHVATWESWNPKVKNGRMLAGEEFFPGATFQFLFDGKPAVGTVTQVERPKSLAWRYGNVSISIRLQADGETTRVSGSAEVSGFMAKVRKSKSEQEASAILQTWLDSLKKGSEA